MSPDSKPPWLPPPAPKMIRRRENGKQADAPCFQESSPCFLSVICFWRNYLKSLIPLSDLPVCAQSPPCFSWKISLFLGEKQGSAARRILRRLEFHTPPSTPAGSTWSRSRSACSAASVWTAESTTPSASSAKSPHGNDNETLRSPLSIMPAGFLFRLFPQRSPPWLFDHSSS